jgi:DNA-binding transcriptional MerR regulator
MLVRKARRRGKRPPAEGLSVAELAAQTGVTPRAVRFYVERGVLPPPDFHSRRTRYSRDHVVRLFAIAAMQKEGLDLKAIRARLTKLASADLERYLPSPSPQPTATGALPSPSPSPSASEATRWDRVTLLPGIELHVHADASPAVRRVAQEIFDQWVVGPRVI